MAETNRDKTITALHALGPKAVEVLASALNGDAPGSIEMAAAQEVLDRMSIRRLASPS